MPANNKRYMRIYMRQWRDRKRKELIKVLGGECVKCGESRHPVLVFHHKNGKSKGGNHEVINGGMQNLLNVIGLVKEGRKDEIELLCERCHDEL